MTPFVLHLYNPVTAQTTTLSAAHPYPIANEEIPLLPNESIEDLAALDAAWRKDIPHTVPRLSATATA